MSRRGPKKENLEDRKPVAIIYIRMSTQYQVQYDSNSSDMQRAACQKMCQEKGFQVRKIIEQVKSGKKYRQDLFDVINNEMRANDIIVVYSISRFARKQLHAHLLLELLTKKKCRLMSVSENLDTGLDDGNVGLYAWLAENESRQTSARVKSSILAKKERGEHVGAMPYGFRYSDGKGSPLEINPEETEVLSKMRSLYNEEKKSISEICRIMNSNQTPTPKLGTPGGWTFLTVKKLIERDDSKILTKGKRSWYIEQDQALKFIKQNEVKVTVLPEEEIETESSEEEDEKEPEKQHQHLDGKSIAFLRIMFRKSGLANGVSDQEINDFSKEELIAMLS